MKKLALLLCLTTAACASGKGPYYDKGHSKAWWDLNWRDKCEYFVSDSTPLKDRDFTSGLKENGCQLTTGHYDFLTGPLSRSVAYHKGYNDYVEEFVTRKNK